ncbi:MAG TPA: MFS transporter, partial [Patescibacteria group bacterium]
IVLINIFDATFWTIGPLFSSSFPEFKHFSGFIMMLYNLPSVFTVWKVEAVSRKFGKKKTAFFSFLLANLFLIPLSFINSPYLTLFCIILSTTACSFTWPAIEGAFTDYVSESGRYESEIEGLTDFTTNLGHVFGPILAGLFSDKIGISHSFALIGFINICLVIFLLFITPKHINVVLKRS